MFMRSTYLSILIFALASTCAFASGPGPLLNSPLLLKTHGAFVEIRDGEYLRIDAINSIEGRIVIQYTVKGKKADPQVFPLSRDSLVKIPSIKQMADQELIGNLTGQIEIVVDGKSHVIGSSGATSPFDDFERFGKSVEAGRAHLEALIGILNRPEIKRPAKPSVPAQEKPSGEKSGTEPGNAPR
jgi:hypothetical protein